MTLRDALLLGRVSNLPTVWTNVLAGAVLSGAELESRALLWTCFALSLFYVAGMYLNDAFDRDFDARARPERPIPSGRVRASTVFAAGFAMLLAAVGMLGAIGGAGAFLAGACLAVMIAGYDLHHKANRFGPVVMGLCRAFVYFTSALALGAEIGGRVIFGAVLLASWIVGLTLFAKRGASVASVARCIAAIALLDAILIASQGELPLAALAVLAFAFTRILQRWVPAS